MTFDTEAILDIVLREMRAVGAAWRMDWSDFDGRTLRDQLNDIAEWAERARTRGDTPPLDTYTEDLARLLEEA